MYMKDKKGEFNPNKTHVAMPHIPPSLEVTIILSKKIVSFLCCFTCGDELNEINFFRK